MNYFGRIGDGQCFSCEPVPDRPGAYRIVVSNNSGTLSYDGSFYASDDGALSGQPQMVPCPAPSPEPSPDLPKTFPADLTPKPPTLLMKFLVEVNRRLNMTAIVRGDPMFAIIVETEKELPGTMTVRAELTLRVPTNTDEAQELTTHLEAVAEAVAAVMTVPKGKVRTV